MAKTSWLFVSFGESQLAVLDLAAWTVHRSYSEPLPRIHFHHKKPIVIQPLVCMIPSKGGSLDPHPMSPKATMTHKIMTRFDTPHPSMKSERVVV